MREPIILEWYYPSADCSLKVFEGDDDTPPIARQSELPTLKSLGAHPATPMDDQVPTTQPEKNVVKVKQEVGEGEDEANSEDEAEDGSEDGG